MDALARKRSKAAVVKTLVVFFAVRMRKMGRHVSALAHFVHYDNHERYHGSLNNLTPADVYYNRGAKILNFLWPSI